MSQPLSCGAPVGRRRVVISTRSCRRDRRELDRLDHLARALHAPHHRRFRRQSGVGLAFHPLAHRSWHLNHSAAIAFKTQVSEKIACKLARVHRRGLLVLVHVLSHVIVPERRHCGTISQRLRERTQRELLRLLPKRALASPKRSAQKAWDSFGKTLPCQHRPLLSHSPPIVCHLPPAAVE